MHTEPVREERWSTVHMVKNIRLQSPRLIVEHGRAESSFGCSHSRRGSGHHPPGMKE